MIAALAISASLVFASAGDGIKCDSAVHKSIAADGYQIAWRPTSEKIKVSEPFVLEIAVCADQAAYTGSLKVDAIMPLHKHGMNLKPKVTMRSPGQFRAEGLMFHMMGLWEFRFTLKKADGNQILTSEFMLK